MEEAVNQYFLPYGYGDSQWFRMAAWSAWLACVTSRPSGNSLWAFRRVADIMQTSDDEMVVSPDLSAMQALERMLALGAERLVVVHDGQLLGLVTRASIGHFIEQRHPSGLSASS